MPYRSAQTYLLVGYLLKSQLTPQWSLGHIYWSGRGQAAMTSILSPCCCMMQL